MDRIASLAVGFLTGRTYKNSESLAVDVHDLYEALCKEDDRRQQQKTEVHTNG
jgi:hypothetical protein